MNVLYFGYYILFVLMSNVFCKISIVIRINNNGPIYIYTNCYKSGTHIIIIIIFHILNYYIYKIT